MLRTIVEKQTAQPVNQNNLRRGYDLETLAEQYSLSVAFIRKLIREEKLKATRVGRRVIVLHEDWEALLRN